MANDAACQKCLEHLEANGARTRTSLISSSEEKTARVRGECLSLWAFVPGLGPQPLQFTELAFFDACSKIRPAITFRFWPDIDGCHCQIP